MKRVSYLFFFFLLISAPIFAQKNAIEFPERLENLKNKNDLSGWIDDRVNYTAENPKERLDFLMASNKLAWRSPVSSQEKEAWLFLLINQGYFQLIEGDILTSINCYEQAYSFYQKNKIPLDVEEYILKPLSNNYTRLGDYERAIYIQNRILQLAIAKKNKELATSAYCNLATSYRSKNDLSNAEQSVKKGLAVADIESDIYGLLLSNQADIQNEKHQYREAQITINRAIQHLKKRKINALNSYWLLSAYTLAGDINLNIKNYTNAEKYYLIAMRTLNSHLKDGRNRENAYLHNQLGKIKLVERKYTEAIHLFDIGLHILIPDYKIGEKTNLPKENSLYGENKLQAALEGKAEALQQLGFEKASLQASILAFSVAEKLRSEFTYTISKQQLQTEAKILAESIIEKSYRLWKASGENIYAEHILVFSEKTKSRILLDEISDHEEQTYLKSNPLYKEKVNLERSLAFYQKQNQENHDINSQKKISDIQFKLSSLQRKLNVKNAEISVDVKEILNKIPSETKAIIFFVGNKNIYRIEVLNRKINQIYQINDAIKIKTDVDSFMKNYFYNGAEAMINSPAVFYKSSYAIFQKLFYKSVFHPNQKLLIIKDGALNFLPFESLITNKDYTINISKWPFLIKFAPISYAYSINSIQNKNLFNSLKSQKFTGIFLSNTGSNKNEIPAVVKEFNNLKDALKGDFYKNQNANISNFKNALNQADVLHISSHSYLTDSLQEPVLELYKSRFYLLELGAQQKVPDLVILSACQTSDGTFVSGEGVLSLSRGFIAAGAKGVISSLWKVNDESAADLMIDYYQNLLAYKHPEKALRTAKLNWLKHQPNKVLLLPYYWDSLIYTGVEQNINLKKNIWTYNPYLIACLIALIISISLIVYRKRKLKHSPNQ